jgi:type IV pilus assembly protein PilM
MRKLYNPNFPISPYLAMNSFAINISDRSIKYGELKVTSDGLHLNKYGREKLPKGIIVFGKIEKEDELVDIFKKIKNKENFNYIRVSLSEEQMYLFTLSVPKTNRENLRDIILFQIEEYIPIKAIDSVFDYNIISEDNQDILVEVIAIASATIKSYLSLFEKVGLVPLSFEIEAQAIARAVVSIEETKPVMIVDFGDTRTGVSIFKNGHIFLTTTLLIGGTDLTNMIAKDFSLSFEEAEKMKHEYGIDQTSKAQNIFPSILNEISILRDELNKQYLYWETHNSAKEGKIDRIILCGGDANLAGLADYLELSMKIKIENANVWTNLLDIKNSVPEISFEESLSYATVVGLSLGGYMSGSQPMINILPHKEKKLLNREYQKRFLIVLLNFITLICIVATLLLFPSYFLSGLKEKLVENKLEIFNKENFDFTNDNIDKITSDINLKLEILDKAKLPYQVNDKVLDNILSSRTNGITLSTILFNKKVGSTGKNNSDTVEIRGIAINRDSLRNFKTTLDNNPNFSEVNLPISDFLEKSNLPFTILIKMK